MKYLDESINVKIFLYIYYILRNTGIPYTRPSPRHIIYISREYPIYWIQASREYPIYWIKTSIEYPIYWIKTSREYPTKCLILIIFPSLFISKNTQLLL